MFNSNPTQVNLSTAVNVGQRRDRHNQSPTRI